MDYRTSSYNSNWRPKKNYCVGELKLICLDGWGKINPSDRAWIMKEANEDEYQYIILNTEDGDLNVKIEGEI